MLESEKKLERKLRDSIKAIGGLCLKLLPFEFSGLPDRICLLRGGIVVFAEIKTTGKTPSKIQIHVHKKLKKLGFRVEVIDTSEKITALIKDYE
jgi:hypothetical protein